MAPRDGIRLQIRVFGDTQFDREIRGVGRRATMARPLFDQLGWELVKIQREQFETQGARGQAGGWRPLAPSTVARKGHDTILVDTSALRDSFMYGDSNNIFETTDDFLHYGSDVDYGRYHQPDPQGRVVFSLTSDDRVDIVKMMQHWVVRGELFI